MLAFIKGKIVAKTDTGVIVENQGLGYMVNITLQTQAQLELAQDVQLFLYEHLKDDGRDLYGFLEVECQALFKLLKSVNGVGARMALNLLDIGNLEALKQAIAIGDKKYLGLATGVGQRLAERICLELKDKLPSFDASLVGQIGVENEVLEALQNLGLNLVQAKKAIIGIDENLDLKERLKQALARITSN